MISSRQQLIGGSLISARCHFSRLRAEVVRGQVSEETKTKSMTYLALPSKMNKDNIVTYRTYSNTKMYCRFCTQNNIIFIIL